MGAEPSNTGATEAGVPTENAFAAALATSTSSPAATVAGIATPAGRERRHFLRRGTRVDRPRCSSAFPKLNVDVFPFPSGFFLSSGADLGNMTAAGADDDAIHAGDLNTSTTATTTTATPVKSRFKYTT